MRRERGRGLRRFRLAYRAGRFLALAAIAVAAAPVTIVAGAAALTASLAGWPPRRLYATALWALPMTVVWLIAIAAGMGGLPA